MLNKKGLILIVMALLFYTTYIFYSSIHNIDTCQNDMHLETILVKQGYQIELKEINIEGEISTLAECYLNGLKWNIYSFHITLTIAMLLGYLIGTTHWTTTRKK